MDGEGRAGGREVTGQTSAGAGRQVRPHMAVEEAGAGEPAQRAEPETREGTKARGADAEKAAAGAREGENDRGELRSGGRPAAPVTPERPWSGPPPRTQTVCALPRPGPLVWRSARHLLGSPDPLASASNPGTTTPEGWKDGPTSRPKSPRGHAHVCSLWFCV